MSKPVYEIPIGDGEFYPPAASRNVQGNDGTAPTVHPSFAQAPPPGSAPGYQSAPPPPNPFGGQQGGYASAPPPNPYAGLATPSVLNPAAPPAAQPPARPATAPVERQAPPAPPALAPVSPPSFTAAPPAPVPSLPSPAPAPAAAYTFDIPAPQPAHKRVEEPIVQAGPAVVDLSPQVGEGEEGSHPDLVAALNAVVTARASDLHITANSTPMLRVDGSLRPAADMPIWDAEKVAEMLHSIMSPRNREIFEEKLELDFAYRLSESARFRVNVYQQRNSMGAAFRLIPTEIKQLDALGIPEGIAKFAQLARGLVLVTGPTGSGKSTTLAALIDLVNTTRADHIVTVEDPIEFMHQNKKSVVNQREVGADTHSFQNALKHVLRQDPDVILIGELRDLETISVALTAAETGHLVFATLHTQDAPQTIDRVIDVFPPHQQGQIRAQLAATLQGVVCQTLVKKIGGGRAVATEVLITTPAVANLIREGKTYQVQSSMQAGRELGMHTMDQHLADLVNSGEISYATAAEKAHDEEVLKRLVTRTGQSSGASQMYGDPYATGQA